MSNVIGLSDYHEANLRKLAAYLKGPELKAAFDMSTYCSDDSWSSNRCGSVGCAVGHAPFCGIRKTQGDLTWGEYSERVFGLEFDSAEWAWCFGPSGGAGCPPSWPADSTGWMSATRCGR